MNNLNKTIFKSVVTFLLIVFSSGWIVPLYLSYTTFIEWGKAEVEPRIYSTEKIDNSFPFLHFAKESFFVAIVWVLLVFVVWSSFLSWYFIWKKKT